jgi:transposase
LPHQHIREDEEEKACGEGIILPLDLPEFRVMGQAWNPDGSLSVYVIAKQETAMCPHCHCPCDQIHDRRLRKKRDLMLRSSRVNLIVLKRRFRCQECGKTFTEVDAACGRRRRTTVRLRETIGKQASIHPVEEVAQTFDVGPRFVHTCVQALAEPLLSKRGLDLSARLPLPTPSFLGIDEFAVHKGHHYATILCDLEHRQVLEVSLGRTLEEVIPLLSRLADPEHVQAVSMDMSASFAPAVRAALPQAHIVVDHFHVIQHLMKAFRHPWFLAGLIKKKA